MIYSQEELKDLKKDSIPKHVAIIPDGNRRWAKKNMMAVIMGHKSGADQMLDIIEGASQIGIKTLTFYTFSTENWNRSSLEVKTLMKLLVKYATAHRKQMVSQGVRMHIIGNLAKMPEYVRKAFEEGVEATKYGNKIDVVLAINYGSRDELIRAINKIKDKEVSEELLSKALDTALFPDPDLVIRTGGVYRISNFLLWQISYSELYFTETLWPDFSAKHFLEAVKHFQKRERRFGK